MSYAPTAVRRNDRYLVKVEQYSHYHKNGFLIIRELLAPQDVERMRRWADDIFFGRTNLPGMPLIDPDSATPEKIAGLLAKTRLHMLHRQDATAEWGLLHPRVLDVVEALTGPDVTALQSMMFFNPPGSGGQGWHQDSYYIRTFPDTLVGAWIALDHADEENGCLWVSPGSHVEPTYPPKTEGRLSDGAMHADGVFADLFPNSTASNMNDDVNELTKISAKYPSPIPAIMQPGDVLFFHSHVLHRSHPNRAKDRYRRSYVCHYCNGRSWVPWNHGEPYEGEAANEHHILARGATHLPYAKPKYGTPVDLNTNPSSGSKSVSMMGKDGMIMRLEMESPPDHD